MIVGVDIGGTNIKLGLVNEKYELIKSLTVPTEAHLGIERVMSNIISGIESVNDCDECQKIGVGTPGNIDLQNGIVRSSGNLPYNNTPISKIIFERFGVPVLIGNDASCAMLAEVHAGHGKKYKDFIMLTLGTGVGGGIVIGGNPYLGAHGAAGEFGHVSVKLDGELCRCGLRGCFEHYASVTALIKLTRKAVEKYENSLLFDIARRDGISGKTAFLAAHEGCTVGAAVVDEYLNYLALGIRNYARIFDPEAIILGGAITKEGNALLAPLAEKVDITTPILISALGTDAGVIGAAALAMKK